MKYVLDSCVALKWVLPEADSPKALQFRAEFLSQAHELIAPDVFCVECAHSIARAERRRFFQPPEGSTRLADILRTLPQLHASLPLLARAFAIASAAQIGVYDCLYVALAERESCELLTADDRLIRALQPGFPFIVALAAL
jgi:predicted nucleic acid-binding protein